MEDTSEGFNCNPNKQRLTWDPLWPFPYESAWSFLTRCMVINHLTLPQLLKLVKICKTEGKNIQRINFIESDWLDFNKLSLLLNVQEQRLRQGFLSYYAFPIINDPFSYYVPRYCEECLSKGYHCVFFDLRSVVLCPWHRTNISTIFSSASKPGEENLIVVNKVSSYRTALKQLTNSFNTGLRPSNCDAIRRRCFDFADWWGNVRTASKGSMDIFNGIFSGNRPPAHMIDDRSWQLGYATALAGRSVPWTLNVSPSLARHASFQNKPPIVIRQKMEKEMAEVEGRFYKSLRSYLYKRYVRRHRTCLHNILLLEKDEQCALNANNVCNVALSYFLWRISVEGVSAWQDRSTPKNRSSLRLMSPVQSDLSNFNRIRWTYYGFFGILNALSEAKKGTEILISFRPRQVCDGWINAYRTLATTSEPNGKRESSLRFDLLYPFVELDLDAKICPLKKCRRNALVDEKTYFNQKRFLWSSKKFEQPVCRVVPNLGGAKSAWLLLFI